MNGQYDWRVRRIVQFQMSLTILEYIPRHYERGCARMKQTVAIERTGWQPESEKN